VTRTHDRHRPIPYHYQDHSVEFLLARHHSILAHEPGLGKSMISIRAAELPCLVVAPACVMINWRREIDLWRRQARRAFDVVSYADPGLDRVDPRQYKTLIVDEAHYVKNHKAKRAKLVCGLIRRVGRRGRVYALSGTLVPNRPIELWALLYAMEITRRSYASFAFEYAAAFEDEWGELNVRGASHLPKLRRILGRHCLRYTKQDVLPELPDLTWRVLALDLPIPRREKEFSLRDLRRMREPVAFEAMSEVLRIHGERKVPLVAEHVRDLLAGVRKLIVFAHHRDVILTLARDRNGRPDPEKAPGGRRSLPGSHL
jgi:SWI/SNF-related matrix-associated actin-dependent regulator 1 of chromatin subfamily A